MTATVTTAHSRSLRRIWATLPDRELGERELDESIIKASDAHGGDYAWASAIRAALAGCGAVTVRAGDAPREFTYERAATFPDLPDNNGPGSVAFNDALRREHEAQSRYSGVRMISKPRRSQAQRRTAARADSHAH